MRIFSYRIDGGGRRRALCGRQVLAIGPELQSEAFEVVLARLPPPFALRYEPVLLPARQKLLGQIADVCLAIEGQLAKARDDLPGLRPRQVQINGDRRREPQSLANAFNCGGSADPLSSLYPAVPVVLALLFLGERLNCRQGFGLMCAALAISLIALR